MSPSNLELLVSTISSFLLGPCLKPSENTPRRSRSRKKKIIVCNQYQQRLYLRPIMPPVTRRASRLMSAGEIAGEDPPRENIELETRGRRRGGGKVKEESLERPVEVARDAVQHMQLEDLGVEENERKPLPVPVAAERGQGLGIEMEDMTTSLLRSDEEEGRSLQQPDGQGTWYPSADDQNVPVSRTQRLDRGGPTRDTTYPIPGLYRAEELPVLANQLLRSDKPDPPPGSAAASTIKTTNEEQNSGDEAEPKNQGTNEQHNPEEDSPHPNPPSDDDDDDDDDDDQDSQHNGSNESITHGDLEIDEGDKPRQRTLRLPEPVLQEGPAAPRARAARLPITGPDPSTHAHLYASSSSSTSTPAPPAITITAAPATPTTAPLLRLPSNLAHWTMIYACDGCEADTSIRGANVDGTVRLLDAMRCRVCGSRCLWKKRTPRIMQFEAR